MADKEIVLEMSGITKQFSGVYALKNANLTLCAGEVHALLGENGAGKSTLIKVLGGIHKPDGGTISLSGNSVKIEGIRDAQKKGISIIHQEIVLVPHISVAENIFLGREPVNALGFKDVNRMNKEAQQMISDLGLNIDVREHVFRLSIAQQQMVEIIKAVSFNSKIIVMDEPTSSLAEKEIKHLFEIIHKLKQQNVSIVYISHKLNELFEISDKITVMRDGEYIGTKNTSETNVDELIKMMVGRELKEYYTRTENNVGETVFEAKGLRKKNVFEDISFYVKAGEVVGFSGLVGAGRSEIMKAIFSVDALDAGDIYIEGKKAGYKNVAQAIKSGIALIPEDRKKEGLVLKSSVRFNLTFNVQDQFKKGIRIYRKKENEIIDKYVNAFSIKCASLEQLTNSLSGGNQQKVVLGKWLATNPKVLILDEPTRGIDVGSKAEIYAIIDKLASQGMAIIMISSDLPEIINMCDRTYVVESGKIKAELMKADYSQEKIMNFAAGGF